MKEIQLTQGKVALVDDEDFEYLNQWKWWAWTFRKRENYYAVRSIYKDGKKITITMHRVVLGLSDDTTIVADHINGDTLDNTKGNLRPATKSQNQMNTKRKGEHGYRGIFKHYRKFQARINLEDGPHSLGSFGTAEEAALAYDAAARKHFGEFARLNFPDKP